MKCRNERNWSRITLTFSSAIISTQFFLKIPLRRLKRRNAETKENDRIWLLWSRRYTLASQFIIQSNCRVRVRTITDRWDRQQWMIGAPRTKLKRPVAKCIGSILSRCRKLRSSKRTWGTIYPRSYTWAHAAARVSRHTNCVGRNTRYRNLHELRSFDLYCTRCYNLLEHRGRWWDIVSSLTDYTAKRQITTIAQDTMDFNWQRIKTLHRRNLVRDIISDVYRLTLYTTFLH